MVGSTEVIDGLRAEGFNVTLSYLRWLLSDRILAYPDKGPGGCLMWGDADVQRLRSELCRRNRGPFSSMGCDIRAPQYQ